MACFNGPKLFTSPKDVFIYFIWFPYQLKLILYAALNSYCLGGWGSMICMQYQRDSEIWFILILGLRITPTTKKHYRYPLTGRQPGASILGVSGTDTFRQFWKSQLVYSLTGTAVTQISEEEWDRPNWVGSHPRAETESRLKNVVFT
jgi:hypothetical protein